MSPSRTSKRANPLSHLPQTALHTLATLLCCPPSSSSGSSTQPSRSWLSQQRALIRAIPRNLSLHRTASLATFFTLDSTVAGRLCAAHADLRPELVFWAYARLVEEVEHHAGRWRRYVKRYPGACPAELGEWVDRLTALRGLWDGDTRVRGGCAACVLSVVGARAQALVDLRAGMLARQQGGKGRTPRLLCLVEAWMDGFAPRATLDMRGESEEMALELGRVRERIKEVRQQGGHRERERERERGEERERRRRRRRHERVSVGRAIADFFGMRFGDGKKKERRHHGSSSHHRFDSSPHRGSSGHHGSSTHRDPASRRESLSRGSDYSSTSRPGSSSSSRPLLSEHTERHSSRPGSSASRVQTGYDQAGYDDQARMPPSSSYTAPYAEDADVPDDATIRRGRSTYGQPPSNGGRQSSDRRPTSDTASRATVRPPADRYSWSSSVYSTDDAGLRAGDAGFRATAAGVRKPLQAVIEGLELGEDDVPLEEEGYDEVCCPSSSDSEDGEGEDDEEEEVEQYVGARAGWAQSQPRTQDSLSADTTFPPSGGETDPTTPTCPICQSDLTALPLPQRTAHCNACIDGTAPPPPSYSRNSRPTVSGIGRMVDEVIDGFGRLSTIDEAAGRFTPRPEVAERVRREYGQQQQRATNAGGSSRRRMLSAGGGGGGYAPSSVGAGLPDDELGPDDSFSVAGGAAAGRRPDGRRRRETAVGGGSAASSRRSLLGGGKFMNVVRDR